jgi:BioD-like phosphotransacetylase family protein
MPSGYPRLVIAGTHSGVGKTTITLALLAALQQRCRRGAVIYTHLHFASHADLARSLLDAVHKGSESAALAG